MERESEGERWRTDRRLAAQRASRVVEVVGVARFLFTPGGGEYGMQPFWHSDHSPWGHFEGSTQRYSDRMCVEEQKSNDVHGV